MAPSVNGSLVSRVASMAEDLTKEAIALATQRPPPQKKWKTLVAGASAGLVVDTTLFPIDTIKSRLQSKAGFSRSGGFSHLYRGLPPVLVGSIPNAAAFFLTYEAVKEKLHQYKALSPGGSAHTFNHAIAAATAEVVSCSVRVPYEVVKMRSQTLSADKARSNMSIFRDIIAREGFVGIYRGFISTVIRDLPFSAIQFPIWEQLKLHHLRRNNRQASAIESAFYGSIAGAIAAFVTTPLDVAKTRIMLADQADALASGKISTALVAIHRERGLKGLFAGVVPRVAWISIGAALFLGSYEKTLRILDR